MNVGLEPVPLKDLKALATTRRWLVDTPIEALPSLTPVRGEIIAEHKGNVLAVMGRLSTIVTLTCDRCLNQFNRQLSCSPSELIWLGETAPSESECQESEAIAAMEGLVECLDPRGSFDPQQWAFEQLNLQLPVVNHCGEHCEGPPYQAEATASGPSHPTVSDPRWNALRQLQSE